MKIPCEYCGQMIPETAQTCPHCGAANSRVKRTAYGVPTTIGELRDYCQHHNLPLQDMRVFLGEDYRSAKAFGIYRDETTGIWPQKAQAGAEDRRRLMAREGFCRKSS